MFGPHVEPSAGIILPDDYIKQVAAAVHAVGGMFVLDCVESGTFWVDLKTLGVDVLLSTPQKFWSASPCSRLVMLIATAVARVGGT